MLTTQVVAPDLSCRGCSIEVGDGVHQLAGLQARVNNHF